MSVTAEVDQAAFGRMLALARRHIVRGMGNYGIDAGLAETHLRANVALDAQDKRFTGAEEAIGQPGWFETPRRILDVGCGTAPFLFSALLRGHDAHGIDNDYERLEIARHKIAAYGLSPQWDERLQIGDATNLRFAAEAFDLVTSWQVLEHIPDLESALFEAVRVTKRGGYLVFWAPDYRAPYEPHYEIPWPPFATHHIVQRWLLAMDRPPGGIGDFHYITLPRVVAVLEMLGVEILEASLNIPIDPRHNLQFDTTSDASIIASASRLRNLAAERQLPEALISPTQFRLAGRRR